VDVVVVEREPQVVVSENIFPVPEVCDRFRCELLGVPFRFIARHSPSILSPSKSKIEQQNSSGDIMQ